jgi:hypothetical protein
MLIALGLINWRYQSGESDTFNNSRIIISIGLLQLIATFTPKIATIFNHKIVKAVAWVISSAAVIFAIIN